MKDLLKSKDLFAEPRVIAAVESLGVSFTDTRIKSLADIADEMMMIVSKNHDLMVSVTCTFIQEMGVFSIGESMSLTSKQKIVASVLAVETIQ